MQGVVQGFEGGALLGAAAGVLYATLGRTAGISGIAAGALGPPTRDRWWRLAFLAGMLCGGGFWLWWNPQVFGPERDGTLRWILAGLLVGIGTRLGRGCTSGHGVCGLARRSLRSTVAVLVFMSTAMVTVLLARWSGTVL